MKMKKGKEQMSVQKQILYSRTWTGISYMCVGIFEFFDNIPCQILCIIFLVAAVYLTSKELSSKKEKYDEMARKNLAEAESFAYELLLSLLCVFATLLIAISVFVPSLPLSLQFVKALLFIIIGAADLMVGIKFHQLEEE